jgi:hypothetical protein
VICARRYLPALVRSGQIALQEGLLPLGTGTLVAVVQFAVEGDEVGISPVEGVVALRAAWAAKGRVEIVEEGGAIPIPHVVVAEDGKDGHLFDELPVRCEEAPIVVTFLAGRIDHVASVQDQIWLEASQQPATTRCPLPPLPLSPTTAKEKLEPSPEGAVRKLPVSHDAPEPSTR